MSGVFGAAFVGRRVLAIADHDRPQGWLIGTLVSVEEDGSFVIDVDRDRRRHYCWPLLHVELVPEESS